MNGLLSGLANSQNNGCDLIKNVVTTITTTASSAETE